MNYSPVQDIKGMCSTPPARSIGWKPAVGCPEVTFILLQTEIFCYLLGITHSLEYSHIFAAREDEGTFYLGIDFHNSIYNIVIFSLATSSLAFHFEEITPYQGRVHYSWNRPSGHFFSVNHVEFLPEEVFYSGLPCATQIH